MESCLVNWTFFCKYVNSDTVKRTTFSLNCKNHLITKINTCHRTLVKHFFLFRSSTVQHIFLYSSSTVRMSCFFCHFTIISKKEAVHQFDQGILSIFWSNLLKYFLTIFINSIFFKVSKLSVSSIVSYWL